MDYRWMILNIETSELFEPLDSKTFEFGLMILGDRKSPFMAWIPARRTIYFTGDAQEMNALKAGAPERFLSVDLRQYQNSGEVKSSDEDPVTKGEKEFIGWLINQRLKEAEIESN